MSPYESVRSAYDFPFELYPFQVDATNELAPDQRSGLYLDPGLGKTAVSTHCALYKKVPVLCVLPPILVTGWSRWLQKVTRKDGSKLDILCYHGSPKQRAEMNLIGHDFVLMSIQIFKRDIERIEREMGQIDLHIILDEAHCIKDVGTANYKTTNFNQFVKFTHKLVIFNSWGCCADQRTQSMKCQKDFKIVIKLVHGHLLFFIF
jgi:superfamily II DNA or RNA helicase